MNAAEKLRAELNNENKEIIANKFQPNKEQIISAIIKGIKRIGYVCIDTSGYDTSTPEGRECGSIKAKELYAFSDFVRAEGFKTSLRWWGLSTSGTPDMINITL